ncbi:ABC transporter permease [Lignipirellula cremea]|uniref:ABC-2 family transporter protein n=1 Tax=Lignipirellula cremea TaxID=2528010 RepID=A0A518DUF4_9BACT|nr:ABC transporter permease [Lignipirellula cremea]QDU95473.1 ABC-2 family transporter protein [Lignipirellula cremea]
MRPYLAIVKDSFRAAMASWVLYICLGCITIVFIALLPLSIQDKVATGLLREEVPDPAPLIERLVTAGPQAAEKKDGSAQSPDDGARQVTAEPQAVALIWSRLPALVQDHLRDVHQRMQKTDLDEQEYRTAILAQMAATVELVEVLNQQLDKPDFFDEKAWTGLPLPAEAQEMQKAGLESLTSEQQKHFNRLAFDAAFPALVQPASRTELQLTYAGMEIPTVPVRKKDLDDWLRSELPWLLDKFVLSIGLVVAIFVTAPILPQMFEPGSLHLLLSKPISRTGLLLARFCGGCAFVLLCATYLFVGCWLIMGLRFGFWHTGFLVCIPIYTFVFMIYYSVSVLAAVLWRNTIVAVLATVLLWGLCWGLGLADWGIQLALDMERPARIEAVGDAIVYLDAAKYPRVWSDGDWKPTLLSPLQTEQGAEANLHAIFLGPVYDKKENLLLAVRLRPKGVFDRPGLDYRSLLIASSTKGESSYLEAAGAPDGAQHLFQEPGGALLVIAPGDTFYRMSGDPLARIQYLESGKTPAAEETLPEEAEDDAPGEDDAPEQHSARTILARLEFPWRTAGPESPLRLSRPAAFAMHPVSGQLAIYSRGRLLLLEKNAKDVYDVVKQSDQPLPGDAEASAAPASLAFAGDTLLVARQSDGVFTVDASTLKLRKHYAEESLDPVQAAASPQGDLFAVRFANGEVWLLDRAQDSFAKADQLKGQGKISAVAFSPKGNLLIGDQAKRLYEYGPDGTRLQRTLAGRSSTMELVYYWVIRPLYLVLPKPGEFHETVSFLMGDKDAASQHPWRPVWTSALFVAVMLGLSCWYMQRANF